LSSATSVFISVSYSVSAEGVVTLSASASVSAESQFRLVSAETRKLVLVGLYSKSITLALKNFSAIVLVLFLNHVYLYPRVTLLGASVKNLSRYMDSSPVIIL